MGTFYCQIFFFGGIKNAKLRTNQIEMACEPRNNRRDCMQYVASCFLIWLHEIIKNEIKKNGGLFLLLDEEEKKCQRVRLNSPTNGGPIILLEHL